MHGNTHNQGHRNNRQSMTIGDQSVQMFHDKVAHRIHLAMGSIGHPCSTIQGSMRYLSVMSGPFSITSLDQANNPCSTVQARGVSVFDETRHFHLVGPDQQPMQYCSSVEGVPVFDETGPTTHAVLFKLQWTSVFDETMQFIYYLVGPTIIILGLD